RQFDMFFGQVRKMGSEQLKRERPDKKPATVAEALYYRGLVALGFEQTPTGPRPVVYIPDDLLKVLPAHKTQYDNLDEGDEFDLPDDEDGEDIETVGIEPLHDFDNTRDADPSVVDDLTTLLACLQLQSPGLDIDARSEQFQNYRLAQDDRDRLSPHLLTRGD